MLTPIKPRSLRHFLGFLLAVALVVATFAWALMNYPKYIAAGAGAIILAGLILANRPRVRRERQRINKQLNAAFQNAYGHLLPPPAIARSYSYGYPAFEIKFRSKVELEAAATRNESFKAEIGKIFKDLSYIRPFDADMAIFFTYDGYLDELRARNNTWDRTV